MNCVGRHYLHLFTTANFTSDTELVKITQYVYQKDPSEAMLRVRKFAKDL